MSGVVIRLRCDSCNREVEPPKMGRYDPPRGWWRLTGEFDIDGAPDDDYHLCSLDCLLVWCERKRHPLQLADRSAS